MLLVVLTEILEMKNFLKRLIRRNKFIEKTDTIPISDVSLNLIQIDKIPEKGPIIKYVNPSSISEIFGD
jgi:hypothetical protein